MRLNNDIHDIVNRMNHQYGEFGYLRSKYPNVAFNHKHWDQTPNSGEWLFATEGFITIPKNYDISFVKSKYKGLITPNSEFKRLHESEIRVVLVNAPGYYNNFWIPESHDFTRFEQKIHGICALNNIYHTGQDGDIVHLRPKWFDSINIKGFQKHSYGSKPWGGIHYKGHPDATPSSPNNSHVISKYKFCLAMEPMYHELWSYNWVTERLWDCFKMKTIPVYYGCYNIQDIVDPSLYVDVRKFPSVNEAILSVVDMGESEYLSRVDKAYEFWTTNQIGSISGIEGVLSSL